MAVRRRVRVRGRALAAVRSLARGAILPRPASIIVATIVRTMWRMKLLASTRYKRRPRRALHSLT